MQAAMIWGVGSCPTTTAWPQRIDRVGGDPGRAFGAVVGITTSNVRSAPLPLSVSAKLLIDGSIAADRFAAIWDADATMAPLMADARRLAAETFYGDLPPTIKSLRLQKGLSQVALADLLGTSQPHISRIENSSDTSEMRADTMRRLCEALGVDMGRLDQILREQAHR